MEIHLKEVLKLSKLKAETSPRALREILNTKGGTMSKRLQKYREELSWFEEELSSRETNRFETIDDDTLCVCLL